VTTEPANLRATRTVAGPRCKICENCDGKRGCREYERYIEEFFLCDSFHSV